MSKVLEDKNASYHHGSMLPKNAGYALGGLEISDTRWLLFSNLASSTLLSCPYLITTFILNEFKYVAYLAASCRSVLNLIRSFPNLSSHRTVST